NVVDEATRQAREAARLDPNLAEAHRLLGSLELTAAEKDPARLPAAIEELSAAHRLAPTDTGTSVALARALLASDRASEAAAILDDLPELGGQPAIMRLTAEAKAKSGQYREAEEIYQELWEADPGDREIAAALIDLYEDEDKLDEALGVLEKLGAKDRDNPAVDERIVLDLARAGRFPEAEQKAREVVAKRPENRAAQRLLATVLFERGSMSEGEKILRGLLDTDPDDPATRRALGSELVRERRFDEARVIYEEMARKTGSDPRQAETKTTAQVELGFIAYLQRDYPGARKILAPVAISDGQVQDRAARILLAADRDGENFAEGRKSAAAFAAAKPSDPEWAAEDAEFRYRLGEKKEAQATLDALGASGQLEKMMAAADAYGRLKLYDAAVRISREAVSKFPESTDALFRLGSSLERAGNSAESEKVFLQLLALRPNDAATLNYLGYMWADQGVQLERAKEMLEKAVAREPRNAAYLDSLGWAYFRLGQMPEAEKNLREAYRREPSDPTIEEHIGDLEAHEGNVEGAIRHWEKALDLKHEEPDRVREKLRRAKAPVSQR
ncbi:MAG TPA: tetratricopeptide repeat protein, partial [Thermoanaerobaculia bacterium]|nr:tetratricopeptide repeat protein [Thermoanaerobaculia bacterium]